MHQAKSQRWIGGAAKIMADGTGANTRLGTTYAYLLTAATNAYLKA